MNFTEEVTVLASYETFIIEQTAIALQFPQNSLVNLNIELISKKIAKFLISEGIRGFLTVDFLVFEGFSMKNTKELLFWAIDARFELTEFLSCFSLYNCLMRDGEFDFFNKKFFLGKDETFGSEFRKRAERSFFFVKCVKAQEIRMLELRDFFEFCKNYELYFDFENREGIVFLLDELLQNSRFGVMIIG